MGDCCQENLTTDFLLLYKEMKRKILHAAGLLKMVRDQLEMAYNETGQFNDAIENVRNLRDEVNDIYSGCYTDE
jgi:hypothetical protein